MSKQWLDSLPPFTIVITSSEVAWQKGFTNWYTPGRKDPVDSSTLSEFKYLTMVWEGTNT